MGNSRWSTKEWTNYSSTTKGMSRAILYARRSNTDTFKGNQDLNPDKIQFRESRDSDSNPNSTPILVALDVSGSMGVIAEEMSKETLGKLVGEILQRKPVQDPHLLFMGIGDAVCGDRAPLQATQFEADNCICDQLTDIWLEGHGGGNCYESYDLAWAFAAYKTKTDAWDKRQQKGYLFTVGDEMFPQQTDKQYFEKVFGQDCSQCPDPQSLLERAQERYSVFHIIVAEGNFARGRLEQVEKDWAKLGKRALVLSDKRYIAEVITSAIAIENGADVEKTIESWNDEKAKKVVRKALYGRGQ